MLLVCSGGREGHVCPFGRVELMRSHDEGKTWGWPRVVLDTEIDDRDAGVLETAQGTLLVTTFTSLYFETLLAAAEKIPAGQPAPGRPTVCSAGRPPTTGSPRPSAKPSSAYGCSAPPMAGSPGPGRTMPR